MANRYLNLNSNWLPNKKLAYQVVLVGIGNIYLQKLKLDIDNTYVRSLRQVISDEKYSLYIQIFLDNRRNRRDSRRGGGRSIISHAHTGFARQRW